MIQELTIRLKHALKQGGQHMVKKPEPKIITLDLVGKLVHIICEYRYEYQGTVIEEADNGIMLQTKEMGRVFIVADRIVAVWLDLDSIDRFTNAWRKESVSE